jgi:hypothetical protein
MLLSALPDAANAAALPAPAIACRHAAAPLLRCLLGIRGRGGCLRLLSNGCKALHTRQQEKAAVRKQVTLQVTVKVWLPPLHLHQGWLPAAAQQQLQCQKEHKEQTGRSVVVRNKF